MKSFFTLLYKDLLCEFRTKHAIYSLLVFVLTTVLVLLFSILDKDFSVELISSLFWIVSFFSTMTGLSRSFVLEEEKHTIMFLRLQSSVTNIYLSKLFYTIIGSLIINISITIAFSLFLSGFIIYNYTLFALTILIGSIALSSAATILSAIISRAEFKGLLFPLLSFPIMLPILITSVQLTNITLTNFIFENELNYLQFQLSYSTVLITSSLMFVKYIFEE